MGSARRFRPKTAVRAHGIENGVTFPIHGTGEWGLLTFNWRNESGIDEHRRTAAIFCGKMFASHVQEALRNVLKENVPPRGQRELTWREKECLLWTAEGKTAWEIAQIINISRRTVVYHLRNAMIKLDATNRTQAAVNAFPHLCLDVEALRRSTNFGELVAVHVVTSEENS